MQNYKQTPADLLDIELVQAVDEWFDVSDELKQRAKTIIEMPAGPGREAAAGAVYAEIQKLPKRESRHVPQEESELPWIIEHCPTLFSPFYKTADKAADRIAGGWLGRAIGRKAAGVADTDYAKLNLQLVKTYGKDFTSEQVLDLWRKTGDISGSAEQLALANFAGGIRPPQTAVCCNPFRESAGGMNRADVFGYLHLGDVRGASEMAWKEAMVSHTKNGIYGNLLMAQMIALAAVETDPKVITEKALVGMPEASRFFIGVSWMVRNYVLRVKWDVCLKEIQTDADQTNPFIRNHVVPNGRIIVAALCYGQGDFEKTLNYALEAGFDTACNAAAVCSVLGVMLSKDGIPAKWVDTLSAAEKAEALDAAAQTFSLKN